MVDQEHKDQQISLSPEVRALLLQNLRQTLNGFRPEEEAKRRGLTREFGKINTDLRNLFSEDGETVSGAGGTPALPGSEAGRMPAPPGTGADETPALSDSGAGETPVFPGSVERDDLGRVVRVGYPNGTVRSFSYAQSGQLSELCDRDGTIWRNREAGIWVQFQQDGKVTGQIWDGNVTVDGDANYIFELSDGARVIERADGSKVVEEKFGYRIEADPTGRVLRIDYADDDFREFVYDHSGIISEVIQRRLVWRRFEGNNWLEIESDGSFTGQAMSGAYTVSEGGDVIFEITDGTRVIEKPYGARVTETRDGKRVIENVDGSRVIENLDGTRTCYMPDGTIITESSTGFITQKPDGSIAEISTLGHVARLQYPDGSCRDFKYDAAGQMAEIKDRDQSIWRRDNTGIWYQFLVNDPELARCQTVSIHLDQQANFVLKDYINGLVHIDRLDGVKIVGKSDGSKTEYGSDGAQMAYVCPSGRRFCFSGGPTSEYIVEDGDTLHAIATDSIAYIYRDTPEYEADKFQIARRMAYIASLNGLKDQSQLESGVTILVPISDEEPNADLLGELPEEVSGEGIAQYVPAASVAVEAAETLARLEHAIAPVSMPPADSNVAPWRRAGFGDLKEEVVKPWSSRTRARKPDEATQAAVEDQPQDLGSEEAESPVVPWSGSPFAMTQEPQQTSDYPEGNIEALDSRLHDAGKIPEPQQDESQGLEPEWLDQDGQDAESASESVSAKTIPNQIPEDLVLAVYHPETLEVVPSTIKPWMLEKANRLPGTKIVYPDGSYRELKYDLNDNLVRITDRSGRFMTANEDGTWSSYTRDGRLMGTSGAVKITCDDSSSLIWEYASTGTRVVLRSDGSAIHVTTDGALREYMSIEKRRYIVNNTGDAECTVRRFDELKHIAADSLKLQRWDTPSYEPTELEIVQELVWLAKDNKFSHEDQLQPGDRITIMIPQL